MGLSIFFIWLTAVICLLVPLAAALIMIIKRRASWIMFVLGIVTFTVTQLLIRIPLLNELQNSAWFNLFMVTQPLLYSLMLALTAGIFEETGRFAAMRFLRRDMLTWENGIVFGLGHGGVEAFWIAGVPYAKLAADTLSGNTAAIAAASPDLFIIAGVERVLAIILHIGFTMLVLYGIKKRNILYFLLAVLAHAVVDAMIPLLTQIHISADIGVKLWLMEAALAVFAVIALIVTLKMRRAINTGAPSSLET